MRLIAIAIACFFAITINAQTLGDAQRYSTLDMNGTARSLGTGGSLGALGGDFTVASINPAGLAIFRNSDVVITPALLLTSTDATQRTFGNTNTETKVKLNLSNIGVVFANQPRNSTNWSTFNVAIGFNRLANYNQRFKAEGTSTNSITKKWSEEATDGFFSDFGNVLALDAGAIYPDDPDLANPTYFTDLDDNFTTDLTHVTEFKSSGSMNEMVFSVAGNLQERFLFGATLGIPFVSYEEQKILEEDASQTDNIDPFFENLRFEEQLDVSGIGLNLKLGMIYRLNHMIRLGAAIHTPSRIVLTETFSNKLEYTYRESTGGIFNTPVESPEGNFEYSFKTPWRLIGNAGVIIGKSGFISGELEWVNYGGSSFNLTKNSSAPEDVAYEEELNGEIEDNFGSAVNFRIGGEYALLKKFRLRAGYNISGTPFASESVNNTALSLGLGVRFPYYYIDLAFKNSQIEESFAPYSQQGGSTPIVVDNNVSNNRILLSIGFKF